jgi:large subunit ribosomal protein L24
MTNPKYKVKKGDAVVILTGKDKGKLGKITKMLLEEGKAIVAGINLKKKHKKPNPQTGEAGGIQAIEAPIAISNIAIAGKDNKPVKVGYKLDGDKKVRINKKTGEAI